MVDGGYENKLGKKYLVQFKFHAEQTFVLQMTT